MKGARTVPAIEPQRPELAAPAFVEEVGEDQVRREGDAFAALVREAETTMAPPALTEGEGEGAGSVPAMSNSACLLMAAQLVRGSMESMAGLKSPAVTMADEKLQPAADALGAVFDKHGWNLQGMAGDYMVELAAIVAVGPLAWGAYRGAQEEIKARAPDKPAPAPAGAAGPVAGAPLPNPEPAAVDLNAPAKFAANDPRSVSLNG